VRFGRDWSQFLFDTIIDNLRSVYNFSCATLDFIAKHSEILVHNLTKDHFNTVSVKLVVRYDVVVSLQTLCQNTSSTTWWAHGRDKDDILNLHVLLSESIVPAFVVHPLTEEFDWRLSTVFFLFRHVQIINKENESLAYWRTVNTFPSLLEFCVHGILSLIS